MKKILLSRDKNYYKMNTHCHSTESDGKMTVEELKEHYKKNGYSIIAFTDHEHLVNNSHLNDENFLAITSCEIAIKEFPHLSTLVKTDMRVCHLNFFAKDPENIDTPCYNSVYDHFVKEGEDYPIVHSCGEYERVYSAEGISEIIKEVSEKGFLVSYNHPCWSLENATDYLGYKGLWAVEIYNNDCVVEGIYEYDINVYDDFLRNGHHMACVAGDDNHKLEHTCGGYIMVNCDKLDYKTVMDALENHEFYSSTGPVIKELYVEDNKAYLTFEKGTKAFLSNDGRRTAKYIAKNPDGENTAVFDILPTDKFIRFTVRDEYGKFAHTNAYFTEEI